MSILSKFRALPEITQVKIGYTIVALLGVIGTAAIASAAEPPKEKVSVVGPVMIVEDHVGNTILVSENDRTLCVYDADVTTKIVNLNVGPVKHDCLRRSLASLGFVMTNETKSSQDFISSDGNARVHLAYKNAEHAGLKTEDLTATTSVVDDVGVPAGSHLIPPQTVMAGAK